MTNTSLQYTFGAISADDIIKDAFERAGVLNWAEDRIKYLGARRSLNFILSHLINRGLNLFTIQQGLIPIIQGINVYPLSNNLSKILDCKRLNTTRQLNGTPSASEGDAAGCFSGSFTSPCVQTTPDGTISYLYSVAQPILYVGVMSAVTAQMSFNVQCSYLTNPTSADWITVLKTPMQQYYFGETQWFALPYTKNAVNWQIVGTNNTIFNIAQVYFNTFSRSVMMTQQGRDSNFQSITNPNQGGTSQFWVYRGVQPTITVYVYPDSTYQFLIYNYVRTIQDVDLYYQSIDVNNRFLNAITANLAYYIAEKIPNYDANKIARLKTESDTLNVEAGKEDYEDVTTIIAQTQDNLGYS